MKKFFATLLALAMALSLAACGGGSGGAQAFMAPWGEFMFASLIAFGDQNYYNVAVGLKKMLERETVQEYFTRFCAAGVLISIPITVLFFLLQKYYVQGVTGGSVKG